MTATDDNSDGPSVKVTLRTIYDKLLDVERKVDPLPAQVADHETRLRLLERSTWMLSGVKGVMALAIAAFGSAGLAHLLK